MRQKTAINKMIDAACGYTPAEEKMIEGKVAARKFVGELAELAEEYCSQITDKRVTDHFWGLFRDRGIIAVGLPAEVKEEIKPLSDKRTAAFLEELIPFGKYAGKTVKEIYRNDSQYLAWLADNPNEFQQLLKRFLARDKYKGI